MKNLVKILIQFLTTPLRILKNIELYLVKIYQKTLSLDYGLLGKVFPNLRSCKYTPTCSEYGYEAINRFGIFKGNYLTIKRVIKCNPWSVPGQYDPVPEK